MVIQCALFVFIIGDTYDMRVFFLYEITIDFRVQVNQLIHLGGLPHTWKRGLFGQVVKVVDI